MSTNSGDEQFLLSVLETLYSINLIQDTPFPGEEASSHTLLYKIRKLFSSTQKKLPTAAESLNEVIKLLEKEKKV